MGFFSWECKVCGVSMRAKNVTQHPELSEVVVIEHNGTILKGEYDGYGRVNNHEIDFNSGEPECYHLHCWIKAGMPMIYTEKSENARDQGYFFDNGDIDCPFEPI